MSSGAQIDCYAVLGVAWGADEKQIKAAYRQKALDLHPDRNSERDTTVEFQQVQHAFDVLKDPVQRAEFDRRWQSRRRPNAGPSQSRRQSNRGTSSGGTRGSNAQPDAARNDEARQRAERRAQRAAYLSQLKEMHKRLSMSRRSLSKELSKLQSELSAWQHTTESQNQQTRDEIHRGLSFIRRARKREQQRDLDRKIEEEQVERQLKEATIEAKGDQISAVDKEIAAVEKKIAEEEDVVTRLVEELFETAPVATTFAAAAVALGGLAWNTWQGWPRAT